MLEKMGWSKGKGLGANLDGSQEFIRISFKGDQQGLGFVDRDDQWTEHENSFNSLLKSLDNSDDSNDQKCKGEKENSRIGTESQTKIGFISGKSLEEQSKQSRARVHYKKFTRGKDLSRYREKDLANIFGKKSISNEVKLVGPSAIDAEECVDEPTEDEEVPNFGITTIETRISVTDYFKNKMKNVQNAPMDVRSIEKGNQDEVPRKKKKKISFENGLLENENNITAIEEEGDGRKRKNRKQSEENANVDQFASLNVENKPKKHKKNKHKETVKIKEENADMKQSVGAEISIEKEVKKKNKNKHKDIESKQKEPTESQANKNSSEIKVKSKKKKKDRNTETAEITASGNVEENQNDGLIDVSEIKEFSKSLKIDEKKMKRKTKEENEKGQQFVSDSLEIVNEQSKRTKKKNKNKQNLDLSPEIFVESLFKILSNLTTKSWQVENESDSDTNKPDTADIKDAEPSENTMEIDSYHAEIFKNTNLGSFCDSSLSNIYGYGYGPNLKLNVITKNTDERRIRSVWDHVLWEKYGAVLKTKLKRKKLNLNHLQKKNVFKGML